MPQICSEFMHISVEKTHLVDSIGKGAQFQSRFPADSLRKTAAIHSYLPVWKRRNVQPDARFLSRRDQGQAVMLFRLCPCIEIGGCRLKRKNLFTAIAACGDPEAQSGQAIRIKPHFRLHAAGGIMGRAMPADGRVAEG